ncbi:MAG TPA: adenosylcobinamide-phosphate synthase CbiB [Methylococcus sp.]|nr:adenosylcobinamide-phosphate synthase CbiB [Methylococcus sp.]
MEVFDRAWIAAAAVVMDRIFGEPPRYHPLVGFGRLAEGTERRLYGPEALPPGARRRRGILAVTLLLSPVLVLAVAIENLPYLGVAASLLGLYLALGGRSLREHGEAVWLALRREDTDEARRALGRIVSRDTDRLAPEPIAAAAVESLLENGCDAVFGALFWFLLAGLPGVVVYRLANTLDAMWGYRNARYAEFGWAAARLDDVLNFLPARLTAIGYALCGNFPMSVKCWENQGRRWKSPNAGVVMAAGAGALRVKLGGPAVYHGSLVHRPVLGFGRAAKADDIPRAIRLIDRALLLWLVVSLTGILLHA